MTTFTTSLTSHASIASSENQQIAKATKSPKSSKGFSYNMKKKVTKFSLSILAKVFFGQSNFDFLDIPTNNLKITQEEINADLR